MTWWGAHPVPEFGPGEHSLAEASAHSHTSTARGTRLQSAWPVRPSTHPSLHSLVACFPREWGVTHQPGGTGEATGQPSVRGDKLSLHLCAPSPALNLQPSASLPLMLSIQPSAGYEAPWAALDLHGQGCPFDFCLPFVSISRACTEGTGSKEWTLHTFYMTNWTNIAANMTQTIAQYSPCLNPVLNGGSKNICPPEPMNVQYLGRGGNTLQMQLS